MLTIFWKSTPICENPSIFSFARTIATFSRSIAIILWYHPGTPTHISNSTRKSKPNSPQKNSKTSFQKYGYSILWYFDALINLPSPSTQKVASTPPPHSSPPRSFPPPSDSLRTAMDFLRLFPSLRKGETLEYEISKRRIRPHRKFIALPSL